MQRSDSLEAKGQASQATPDFVTGIVERLIVEAFTDLPTTLKRSESFGEEIVFDMVGVSQESQHEEPVETTEEVNQHDDEDEEERTQLLGGQTTSVSLFVGSKVWLFGGLVVLLLFVLILAFGYYGLLVMAAVLLLYPVLLLYRRCTASDQLNGYAEIS